MVSDDKKSIDKERELSFILKNNSLKSDLANFEEFGIKEKEFSELFKYEPIYYVAQYGKFLFGDPSEILTFKQ